jgi:hypothetical protein
MGKIGVVLAILAFGSMALILLMVIWSRVGALGNASELASAGVRPDELRRRREVHAPRATVGGTPAVVTLLRPRSDKRVSAS